MISRRGGVGRAASGSQATSFAVHVQPQIARGAMRVTDAQANSATRFGPPTRLANARAILEQGPKLVDRQSRVAHDTAQGEGIDGIVAWHGQDALPVGHDRVLALADNAKPGLSECANGIEMVDARDLSQGLDRDLDFPHLLATQALVDDEQVLADSVPGVVQRFLFGGALRPAARQAGNRDAVPLVRMVNCDLVLHWAPLSKSVAVPPVHAGRPAPTMDATR